MTVPERLPSGRHGLSRETVVSSQRTRLLEATIAAVDERGYQAASIVDIAGRAGVSRATLYELFGDKEGAFLAAHDWLIERLLQYVRPVWERPGPWSDRMRRGLAALLTAIAARPEGARVAMVEVLAAGPRAHQRHRAAIRAFAPFVDEGREESRFGDRLPANTSRVIVGGAAALIYEQVAAGHATDLRRLHPELVYNTLLPYVGHERALDEMQTARARA